MMRSLLEVMFSVEGVRRAEVFMRVSNCAHPVRCETSTRGMMAFALSLDGLTIREGQRAATAKSSKCG